jgi:hypothetical protein
MSWRRPLRNTMRSRLAVTFALLAFTLLTFAQKDLITLKTDAASAFIWDEDNQPGAVSSSVRDPVTGNAIHKLSHAGIEVSSRAGFERIGSGKPGEYLSFTTTIVNSTEFEVFVRQGGVSVEGHVALPLPVTLNKKGLSKNERAQVWELARMNCFSSGFLPNEIFLSPHAPNKVFAVAPKRALTVSVVTKDPRHYSILCSVDGCYPKGRARFSITINTTDFVFVWPGRSMVDCGK